MKSNAGLWLKKHFQQKLNPNLDMWCAQAHSAVDSAVVSASSLVGYNLLIYKRPWSNVDYQVKKAKFYNDNTRLCCGTFWRPGEPRAAQWSAWHQDFVFRLQGHCGGGWDLSGLLRRPVQLGHFGECRPMQWEALLDQWEVPNFNASSSYRSPTPWIVKWVSRCGTTLPVQCQQPWRPPGKSQHDEG